MLRGVAWKKGHPNAAPGEGLRMSFPNCLGNMEQKDSAGVGFPQRGPRSPTRLLMKGPAHGILISDL